MAEPFIQIHGYKCAACGKTMEEIYGSLGVNFVEVHHAVPLHTLEEEMVVNPRMDMVCLCPNCHRIIHRKNGIMIVDELREVLISTGQKKKA